MPQTRRAAVVTILASLASVFLLDAAIFRTGFYLRWMEPDSSTGLTEYRYRAELDRQKQPGKLVLTFGDSRFAYLPRVANQFTAESGFVFRHAGTAGSSARDWYYLMRDLDPEARQYQAVVVGLDDLEDEESLVSRQDDPRSLHYSIGRLGLGDLKEFALSHDSPTYQWAAVRGGILKGIVMQEDVHDLLLRPRERAQSARLNWGGWAGWAYDYDDEERSLAGLAIDWKTRAMTYPPGMDPGYKKMFNETLLRKATPSTGRRAAYQRKWFGRMVEHYRNSETRFVFVRLPRGPLSPLEDVPLNPSSSVRVLAKRPRVYLGAPLRYASLERPEYFKDPLHLNRAGAHAFSKMLVDEVRELIGPPR
ncbi:MAG: hypothetical protein K2X03_17560 [Bryobacteraceae bacterium]|nr:hypothetical protein [Bryobacteraceae bacterium]